MLISRGDILDIRMHHAPIDLALASGLGNRLTNIQDTFEDNLATL